MLDEESIDSRIRIESIDLAQQLRLRTVAWNLAVEGGDAYVLAGLMLLAHVAGAGAVFADEDGARPGVTPFWAIAATLPSDVFQDGFGDWFPLE